MVRAVLVVWSDSFALAGQFGHQWVGPEHVLLAILDDSRPSLARVVLNELGVTRSAVEAWFLGSLLDASPPVRSTIADRGLVSAAPVFYELQGWTEGFAAATGVSPSAETALIGLCTLHRSVISGVADPNEVVMALVARGVVIASALVAVGEPERHAEVRRVDVPIDNLTDIRCQLMDAGVLVGFNTDTENGRAWVIVKDGTDTPAATIADILGDGGSA
jgi:Clp amino terminal domain, pathogenicity island component